jgi:hypothetical protein
MKTILVRYINKHSQVFKADRIYEVREHSSNCYVVAKGPLQGLYMDAINCVKLEYMPDELFEWRE